MKCKECKFFHENVCYVNPPKIVILGEERPRPVTYENDLACKKFEEKK